ncbi:MAG: porin [Pirellulales bacterium]|nr:porin [Pirellulales bacterium]
MKFRLRAWICLCGLSAASAVATASASAAADYDQSALAASDVAPAGPAAIDHEYAALVGRLEAAETRIQQLEGRPSTGAGPGADHALTLAGGDPQVPATEQRIEELEKAVEAQKAPTYPSVKLTGFFHLDAGDFNQDATNMAALGDIQNGVGFRRARLGGVGNLSEFTAYSIEMDFATAGRPSFLDVWGEQQQIPMLGNVRIGHFRQATSMTSLTSIRQLWLLERPLPFQALDPFRRVGAMAYDKSEDEMWSWAYGVYRTDGFNNAPLGDTRFATDIGDNGGVSAAGRLTHLLYYDEAAEGRYLVHVGGHYNYSRITSSFDAPFYQARAIPEFFVGDPAGGGLTATGTPFFVDTGRIPSDQFHFFGLQLGGQYGPSHVQAEYMGTQVDQLGNRTVYYDGAYVQGGYFLTGEHRTYNRMVGVFDRVTPYEDFFGLGRNGGFCGWGAWEATARYSYVDLRDPNAAPLGFAAGPPPSPNPGRVDDVTFGMNWYWNAHSKLQFNYIHAFLDNGFGDSDCDIYCGRFQIDF